MNINEEILSLGLPEGSYLIVGSSVLAALGLREPYDIDMIVTDEVFDMLDAKGWQHHEAPDQMLLRRGHFDIGTIWSGMKVDELKKSAIDIDGLPCISLQHLKEWKQTRLNRKDIEDIKMIEEYLKAHPL